MRYFLVVFLLLSTIIGNVYLSNSIENHVYNQRNIIANLTELQKNQRYKNYKEIAKVETDFRGYTVFQFSSTFFVAFCLLVCEKRRRKNNEVLESEKQNV